VVGLLDGQAKRVRRAVGDRLRLHFLPAGQPGQWVDKVAAGAVSLFILWPLAVTAAIGAWGQMEMPKRIFESVADYVERNTGPTIAVPEQPRPAPRQAPPGTAERLGQLKELAALRDQGILTQEEFQQQKARLLH
jgi:hypothetical protein